MKKLKYTPQEAIKLYDPETIAATYKSLTKTPNDGKFLVDKWEFIGLFHDLEVQQRIDCAILFEVLLLTLSSDGLYDVTFDAYKRNIQNIAFPVIRRTYSMGVTNGNNVGHIINDLVIFWAGCTLSNLIDMETTIVSKCKNSDNEEYELDNEAELCKLVSDMIVFKYGGNLVLE